MLALLALASGALWGTSDFFAGLRSRTVRPAAVVGLSQAAALLGLTVIVVAVGGLRFDGWQLWALVAGVCGAVGLISFYAALAAGTMGVVAAIASLGSAVPVILGVLTGDTLGPRLVAGIVVAIAGAALASGPELSGTLSRTPVLLALVAAVAFGFALFSLDRGSRVSMLYTLWGMRLTTVALFATAALFARNLGGATRRDGWPLVLIGTADVSANALFAIASTRGLVSVAAVLASLYPLATLLWARALLGERLRRVQLVGVGTALAGVALMSV